MIVYFTWLVVIIHFYSITVSKSQQFNEEPNENHHLSSSQIQSTFSGIYIPSTIKTEVFAGAILVHRQRFLLEKTINSFKQIFKRGIEQAVLAILFQGANVMTRDYFDFQVLHLSSTLNQLQRHINKDIIQDELIHRMKSTILEYRTAYNSSSFAITPNSMYHKTVAIIPFTSKPGSLSTKNKQDNELSFIQKLRLLFFEATILSISQYFQHIAVTVCTGPDYYDILSLASTLPIWQVIDLSSYVKDKYMLLPKETMLYVYRKFSLKYVDNMSVDDKVWLEKTMVYYSESDQILHARGLNDIDQTMMKMNGAIAVIPHRMHTTALPKTFTKAQLTFKSMLTYVNAPAKLKDLGLVELIIEHPISPQGSCCDDGRFLFGSCGNWWYHCPSFGLQNYSTWARFGANGYTLPLGTPHQAKCKYYPDNRVTCPLPSTCTNNDPSRIIDICEEIPNLVKIG